MSITYGFYNSLNHDRRYNATQMSRIFDGIIKDGIFMSIGHCFEVKAGNGMVVNVNTGKAWFNHTWTENDSILPVTIYQSEVVLNRIDSLVLEVDATDSVRKNSIKFIKGVPSSSPVPTALIDNTTIHQHLLCTVYIKAGVTAITDADIRSNIGTETTPFVSGILETVSIDSLLGQWQSELDNFVLEETQEFQAWFNDMKGQLSTDAAGHLQAQINTIVAQIAAINARFLNANTTVYVATTGSDTTGDGTSSKPYKTIAKGLSVIPKNLNEFDATLNIAGGTYAEAINIVGYFGGILNLVFGGNTTVNYIFTSSSPNIYLSASSLITITINNTTQIPVRVYNSSSLRTNNINFVLTTTTSIIGLVTSVNSHICILNSVTINTSSYAVLAQLQSYVYIGTLAGTGNDYGIVGTEGAIISYGTKTISAANGNKLANGAIITNEIFKGFTTTLSTTGWTASTTYPGYYEKTVTVFGINDLKPMFGLVPENAIPSAAESTAYGLIKGMVGDSTAKTLKFLASAVPATAITITVKGVS